MLRCPILVLTLVVPPVTSLEFVLTCRASAMGWWSLSKIGMTPRWPRFGPLARADAQPARTAFAGQLTPVYQNRALEFITTQSTTLDAQQCVLLTAALR